MKPVFVALDTSDLERARELAEAVREHAGGVKLGLEFYSANGPAGIRAIAELGLPLFLDLKLHDIPNTVAGAIEALAPLNPAVLSVHAAGGRAMLAAAKAAAPPASKVVAVTVLTSLDAVDLAEAGVICSPREQVERFAELARDAGVDGIVCSGAELLAVRRARGPPARQRPRRSEADSHSARGARGRSLDPGHRPPDHRGRGPRTRHS